MKYKLNLLVRIFLLIPWALILYTGRGAYWVGEGADYIYRKSSLFGQKFINWVDNKLPLGPKQ